MLIFGFWTNIHLLDKFPGIGKKSLGPWTNPWTLYNIKIKLFKLRGGYGLKIENPASLSSVKVPQEQECVFKICIYSPNVSKKTLVKTIKILQKIFLQIQQTKNT